MVDQNNRELNRRIHKYHHFRDTARELRQFAFALENLFYDIDELTIEEIDSRYAELCERYSQKNITIIEKGKD